MYHPSLTLDSGIGAIGGIDDTLSVQLSPESDLMRSLQAVHRRSREGSSIDRVESASRRHWAETGISRFVRGHLQKIGCEPSQSSLPVSTYEWVQNAAEHGVDFSDDISVQIVAGEEGIVAGITDSGQGFSVRKNLQDQEDGKSLLYDAQGYPMGRGFGLHGVLNSVDVLIGFESVSEGFRVVLLSGRNKLANVLTDKGLPASVQE